MKLVLLSVTGMTEEEAAEEERWVAQQHFPKGLPLRLRQLIENHHGALDRLLRDLDHPKTAGECFMALFKRKIKAGEYGLALAESFAHLHHLYLQGQVRRAIRALRL